LEAAKPKKKWTLSERRKNSNQANHSLKLQLGRNCQRLDLTAKAKRKLLCTLPKEDGKNNFNFTLTVYAFFRVWSKFQL
jgi:hypothetical protein